MLNFYYMYAAIWGGIFLLYSLPFSTFNKTLSLGLKVFLILTVGFCLIMGTLKKRKFTFQYIRIEKYNRVTTLIMVALFLADFIYAREIPLISILFLHSSSYMDFQGIPTLHVFIVAAGALDAIYLFYRIINAVNKFERRKIGIDFLIVFSMFLLMFYRGMLLMIGYCCMIMFLATKSKAIFTIKNIICVMACTMIVLFVFGVLGNIRSGFQWNDSHLIEQMGHYRNNYPTFLPKEYMWSYSYLTSPLANLNNFVLGETVKNFNLQDFMFSVIPDFISKRMRGTDSTLSRESYNLMAEYFNASTGYIESYYAGGFLAMYLYFLVEMGIVELCLYLSKGSNYQTVCLAVTNLIVAFTFFNNTLAYSALSLQLVLVVILAKMSKIRFVFGNRKIFGGN